MAERGTVALAGATGFLGRRLADRLMADGWRVRALVRRAADQAALAAAGIAITPGDLADTAALARLADGADVAINCAGLIKARRRGDYFEVNRDGAARFAAAHRGRTIHVSSLAAREPQLSDYAASKRAGESAARTIAGDRLAVIRPPAIYGPGDRETLGLFRLAQRSPLAPVVGAATARVALAHVDDVARTIVALVDRPALSGTWAVGGHRPAGYAWSEILRAAWRAIGREARLVHVPSGLVRVAALASEALAAAGGSASVFNCGKAREMAHADWSVAPEEVIPGGPEARFSLAEGFADTVAWYREAGWL